jgi:hypothetical protein
LNEAALDAPPVAAPTTTCMAFLDKWEIILQLKTKELNIFLVEIPNCRRATLSVAIQKPQQYNVNVATRNAFSTPTRSAKYKQLVVQYRNDPFRPVSMKQS